MFHSSVITADWLMVTYFHGDAYNTHCGKAERKAMLMIICDPDEATVRKKIQPKNPTVIVVCAQLADR